MKMRSVMSHAFNMVPSAEIQRSSFDRSHGNKTTFDAGYLIPCFVDEALPGDTFNLKMNGFARLATPIFPVMDNMVLETFYFAVPMRLLWDNWQRFCGERDPDPDSSVDFTIPIMEFAVGGFVEGSVPDYMGVPLNMRLNDGSVPPAAGSMSVSALFLRAYYLIWNEWFRDQNLQDSCVVSKGDGPDVYVEDDGIVPPEQCGRLVRRGKRHDYFTSSLPWPQKGDAVELPLGTTAQVVPDGVNVVPTFAYTGGPATISGLVGESDGTVHKNPGPTIDGSTLFWGDPGLVVDLSSATAATINQLRQAFQVQRLLERDARGGTRYTEIIRAHFGVVSPDARLQRPEYLGGGSTPVNIVAVPQTSGTTVTPPDPPVGSPQGNLAGYGTASLSGHGFVKSFTEHCILIGLVNVRADLTYQEGLNRMWSRQTRFDFFWPALSHIGEQAVLKKEIVTRNLASDETVWGYQERYAEYRYKPSVVTGLFRSGATGTLDSWHLAMDFGGAEPFLDDEFIQDNPPIDRVIAVQTEPHFLFDSFFSLRCARPMPVFGVPGLIDHF